MNLKLDKITITSRLDNVKIQTSLTAMKFSRIDELSGVLGVGLQPDPAVRKKI